MVYSELGIHSPAAVEKSRLEEMVVSEPPKTGNSVIDATLAFVYGLIQAAGFVGKFVYSILDFGSFLRQMFGLPEIVAWGMQLITWAIYTVALIELFRGITT